MGRTFTRVFTACKSYNRMRTFRVIMFLSAPRQWRFFCCNLTTFAQSFKGFMIIGKSENLTQCLLKSPLQISLNEVLSQNYIKRKHAKTVFSAPSSYRVFGG